MDKVSLSIEISKANHDVIVAFCGIQGITVSDFIDNIISESRQPIEELIEIFSQAKEGAITLEELQGYTKKFDGIAKAFDSLKIK